MPAPKPKRIPEAVADKAIQRLRKALEKQKRSDLASSLLFAVKGPYIYVAEADGSPLCRLRQTGKPNCWALQMFKWSSENYDTENDFMFGGGTLEECIGAAVAGYQL